ncbi:sigma-70 family RNA polymerase sigma factor [Candidatus Fermentibacteria bacterium]|nr:sigma-70 family RNA polymerase sigma factor [Candidatus Fermentibacteria bacterium]
MEVDTQRKTEDRLVRQALRGSAEAFCELVERKQGAILREMTSLLRSASDAQDVVQEAFLTAYLKLDRLGPPYNFGGWVRQIALNKARNLLTRGPRMVPVREDRIADTSDDPAGILEEEPADRVRMAVEALSGLSHRLRETARLYYLEGRCQKSIARRLDIPVGTVKSRLWEGRRRLRKEVGEMSEEVGNVRTESVVPDIEITEVPGEEMKVESRGPGLYFGTVLEVGHSERCRFFDYPGGVLTLTVGTRVVRKVEVCGEECFEVLVEHADCEPAEPNVLDYFRPTEEGYLWVMRVTADASYPSTTFMAGAEELFPGSYSSEGGADYLARVVRLKVGDTDYGRCLAVFWGTEGGTPAESFYTSEGRQVLHRRYVGPEAPKSENYSYPNLEGGQTRMHEDRKYRLWYDTVLTPLGGTGE